MLASAPASTRVHTGGGTISVRVNGTAVESQKSVIEESVERFSGNVSSQDNAGNSSEWATATITWRNGAQRTSDGSSNLVHNNNNNNASLSADINGPTPQLVHVIRVKPSDLEKEEMDSVGNGTSAVNKAQIRITAPTNGTYVNNVGYCKDKISVMVGSTINQIVKGEDERSSSGASSAPGSDCERSDSDREADDGTDSGFCLPRRHCARVSVTANNTTNHCSITSDSSVNESRNESSAKTSVSNGQGNNVRLTIASYSDKDLKNENLYTNEDMHFHIRELESSEKDNKPDFEDIQTKLTKAHALLSGQGDGSYSLKNRVRSSIVSLLVQSTANRNYTQEEEGRVVFYTTSLGIVRSTAERCLRMLKILQTLMVRYEERDLYLNRGYQEELKKRLGIRQIILPQLFVEGRHIGVSYVGNIDVVEQLNEIGELRDILRPYKRSAVDVRVRCMTCGGYKYIFCPSCKGTGRSAKANLYHLRCSSCDETGTVRCPVCMAGEF